MPQTDYIPQKDEDFLTWVTNLVTTANANKTAWGLPEADITALQGLLTTYSAALTAAKAPNHGKLDIDAKNTAKTALVRAVRDFVNSSVRFNKQMSDLNKEAMGVRVPDKNPSQVPPPSTIPEAEIDSSVIRQLTVHFRDNGSDRRGKPAGVHGAEIRWDIRTAPPATVEDLKNSVFDTKTPYTFTFEENQRGQMVYFCLRWEGTTGEKKGPWGEIYSGIVP